MKIADKKNLENQLLASLISINNSHESWNQTFFLYLLIMKMDGTVFGDPKETIYYYIVQS